MKCLADVMLELNSNYGMPVIDSSLYNALGLSTILGLTPSNKGRNHHWSKYSELPPVSNLNLNGKTPMSSINKHTMQTALHELTVGSQETESEIAESPLGLGVFDEEMPLCMRSLAERAELCLFKGAKFDPEVPFKGLWQLAEEDNHVITVENGKTTEDTDVIFVVKSDPELSALYNPTALAGTNHSTITTAVNRIFKRDVADSAITGGIVGRNEIAYVRYIMQIGLVDKTGNHVAMVRGIDATHKPTVKNIQDAIDYLDGRGLNNVYLVCNTNVRRMLDSFKENKLQTVPVDSNYRTLVEVFDNAPVITDTLLRAEY